MALSVTPALLGFGTVIFDNPLGATQRVLLSNTTDAPLRVRIRRNHATQQALMFHRHQEGQPGRGDVPASVRRLLDMSRAVDEVVVPAMDGVALDAVLLPRAAAFPPDQRVQATFNGSVTLDVDGAASHRITVKFTSAVQRSLAHLSADAQHLTLPSHGQRTLGFTVANLDPVPLQYRLRLQGFVPCVGFALVDAAAFADGAPSDIAGTPLELPPNAQQSFVLVADAKGAVPGRHSVVLQLDNDLNADNTALLTIPITVASGPIPDALVVTTGTTDAPRLDFGPVFRGTEQRRPLRIAHQGSGTVLVRITHTCDDGSIMCYHAADHGGPHGPGAVQDLTLVQGAVADMAVVFRPAVTHDARPEVRSAFSLKLAARYAAAGREELEFAVACRAAVLVSRVDLPRDVYFGDTAVGSSKTAPLPLQNMTDREATVELSCDSRVVSLAGDRPSPSGVFRTRLVLQPREKRQVELAVHPRRVNPDYRKELRVADVNGAGDTRFVVLHSTNVAPNDRNFDNVLRVEELGHAPTCTVGLRVPHVRSFRLTNVLSTAASLRLFTTRADDIKVYRAPDAATDAALREAHDDVAAALDPDEAMADPAAFAQCCSRLRGVLAPLEAAGSVELAPGAAATVHVVMTVRSATVKSAFVSREDTVSIFLAGRSRPRVVRLAYRCTASLFTVHGQKHRDLGRVAPGERHAFQLQLANDSDLPLYVAVTRTRWFVEVERSKADAVFAALPPKSTRSLDVAVTVPHGDDVLDEAIRVANVIDSFRDAATVAERSQSVRVKAVIIRPPTFTATPAALGFGDVVLPKGGGSVTAVATLSVSNTTTKAREYHVRLPARIDVGGGIKAELEMRVRVVARTAAQDAESVKEQIAKLQRSLEKYIRKGKAEKARNARAQIDALQHGPGDSGSPRNDDDSDDDGQSHTVHRAAAIKGGHVPVHLRQNEDARLSFTLRCRASRPPSKPYQGTATVHINEHQNRDHIATVPLTFRALPEPDDLPSAASAAHAAPALPAALPVLLRLHPQDAAVATLHGLPVVRLGEVPLWASAELSLHVTADGATAVTDLRWRPAFRAGGPVPGVQDAAISVESTAVVPVGETVAARVTVRPATLGPQRYVLPLEGRCGGVAAEWTAVGLELSAVLPGPLLYIDELCDFGTVAVSAESGAAPTLRERSFTVRNATGRPQQVLLQPQPALRVVDDNGQPVSSVSLVPNGARKLTLRWALPPGPGPGTLRVLSGLIASACDGDRILASYALQAVASVVAPALCIDGRASRDFGRVAKGFTGRSTFVLSNPSAAACDYRLKLSDGVRVDGPSAGTLPSRGTRKLTLACSTTTPGPAVFRAVVENCSVAQAPLVLEATLLCHDGTLLCSADTAALPWISVRLRGGVPEIVEPALLPGALAIHNTGPEQAIFAAAEGAPLTVHGSAAIAPQQREAVPLALHALPPLSDAQLRALSEGELELECPLDAMVYAGSAPVPVLPPIPLRLAAAVVSCEPHMLDARFFGNVGIEEHTVEASVSNTGALAVTLSLRYGADCVSGPAEVTVAPGATATVALQVRCPPEVAVGSDFAVAVAFESPLLPQALQVAVQGRRAETVWRFFASRDAIAGTGPVALPPLRCDRDRGDGVALLSEGLLRVQSDAPHTSSATLKVSMHPALEAVLQLRLQRYEDASAVTTIELAARGEQRLRLCVECCDGVSVGEVVTSCLEALGAPLPDDLSTESAASWLESVAAPLPLCTLTFHGQGARDEELLLVAPLGTLQTFRAPRQVTLEASSSDRARYGATVDVANPHPTLPVVLQCQALLGAESVGSVADFEAQPPRLHLPPKGSAVVRLDLDMDPGTEAALADSIRLLLVDDAIPTAAALLPVTLHGGDEARAAATASGRRSPPHTSDAPSRSTSRQATAVGPPSEEALSSPSSAAPPVAAAPALLLRDCRPMEGAPHAFVVSLPSATCDGDARGSVGTVRLENTGGASFSVAMATSAEWLQLDATAATIRPGDVFELRLRGAGPAAGSFVGYVTIDAGPLGTRMLQVRLDVKFPSSQRATLYTVQTAGGSEKKAPRLDFGGCFRTARRQWLDITNRGRAPLEFHLATSRAAPRVLSAMDAQGKPSPVEDIVVGAEVHVSLEQYALVPAASLTVAPGRTVRVFVFVASGESDLGAAATARVEVDLQCSCVHVRDSRQTVPCAFELHRAALRLSTAHITHQGHGGEGRYTSAVQNTSAAPAEFRVVGDLSRWAVSPLCGTVAPGGTLDLDVTPAMGDAPSDRMSSEELILVYNAAAPGEVHSLRLTWLSVAAVRLVAAGTPVVCRWAAPSSVLEARAFTAVQTLTAGLEWPALRSALEAALAAAEGGQATPAAVVREVCLELEAPLLVDGFFSCRYLVDVTGRDFERSRRRYFAPLFGVIAAAIRGRSAWRPLAALVRALGDAAPLCVSRWTVLIAELEELSVVR